MKKVRSWSKPYLLNLIGRKRVDWSIFQYGTQIPLDFHEDFAQANANKFLRLGERVPVELLVDEETYKATLVYFQRKNSEGGSLQLRYDQNTVLKELLKSAFTSSYEFFSENREEKSKKPVYTPDEMAEYIDFYQTETPFKYRVSFQKKEENSNPAFWWVNQGKTHNQEKEGGFLWAPQKSKRGFPVPHHVSLLRARVGDFVFCYSDKEIKALGIVQDEVVESNKPSEIVSNEWQEDGYLLSIKYFEIQPKIKKEDIPLEWRVSEAGPFDVNGDIKQGYFFELSDSFASKLCEQFKERLPREVVDIIGHSGPEQDLVEVKEQPQQYTSRNLTAHIYSFIRSKGFYYTETEINNLYLSLKTKPFVILSGISGTGKTKIVQWLAESVGATEENGQFALIPVRPDWSDGSDLLGYTDIKGDFKEGPLTTVLKNAIGHPDLPYFVLLDEMNLARVEHYFSDLLSVMESRKWENGKLVTSLVLPKEVVGSDVYLPSNVYIIGTVNMDETTHPFSKKVLDRANTLEFNRVKLDHLDFLLETTEKVPIVLHNDVFATKYLHLKGVYAEYPQLVEEVTGVLVEINKVLQISSANVGYRVRDEICFYLAYNDESNLMERKEALDHCILQKILPRLSGSDTRIERVLKALFKLFTNKEIERAEDGRPDDLIYAVYPKSAEKVLEMIRRLEDDGFTSFWISS
ncbi:McrB family protein [Halalkalibacter krulwichiae]|uniref:5-methylcytosine-specific restriction enzyme B n=1 Tax=Halalkalibacter krulwichiae TaxID=199441 RepID=A0A1X9MDB6_9BACI|nr:AAA family ATPase [Halalkalibacter krulwichiae]ARK30123.1 5-methylcytosine-specific restriction enzyme B [Halalkalibacter krulwichiae]